MQILDHQPRFSATVLLVDDDVLRDVDQPAGEIARVGCSNGGVGQTLAGTVRREEYSSTQRPSRNEERIGSSMIRPEGSAIRPRMPAIWEICCSYPWPQTGTSCD